MKSQELFTLNSCQFSLVSTIYGDLLEIANKDIQVKLAHRIARSVVTNALLLMHINSDIFRLVSTFT